MQGIIEAIEVRAGVKGNFHKVKIGGKHYTCFNLKHQQAGDPIVYDLVTKGNYTNLVISDEVPERDVTPQQPAKKGFDRDQNSIIAQNLLNRAVEIALNDKFERDTPDAFVTSINKYADEMVQSYYVIKHKLDAGEKEAF